MESALGVPIPYWESPIDFEMEDPTQSILWTKKYFGNGFGFTKTGPFAYFQTPIGPLIRNIGSDGSLMEYGTVNKILTKYRLAQISNPTAEEGMSLEEAHNGVHIWVDGQMNTFEHSPYDPVFFCHHSFVDYVWDVFRTFQTKRGIDPTTDTVLPPENVTLQNITDPAVGLFGYYNSDGYSNMIAALYKYKSSPQCPLCSISPDLFCDHRINVCVSRRRNPVEYIGKQDEALKAAIDNGLLNGGSNSDHPYPLYVRDWRVRMDSVTLNYDRETNGDSLEINNALLKIIDILSKNHNHIFPNRGLNALNANRIINTRKISPRNNYWSVSNNVFFGT